MLDELTLMLHAQAVIVLVELSRLDVPCRAKLLARARGHFNQLPAEMRDQVPVLARHVGARQLIEGDNQQNAGTVDPAIDPDNDS